MKMKIKKSHVNINVSLLILILSLTVAGTMNQRFTPQYKPETPKSSDGEITIITPENKTYTEPDNGYYPATYGFENDLDGSNPEDWVIWDEGDIIEVIDELDGHKKVLRLYDSSTSSQNHVQKEFSAKDHGQIEFWLRTTDTNDHVALDIKATGDVRLFVLGINSGNFYREDGSGITVITPALNNNWYHIRIAFRASFGSDYEGLSSTYSWKVFIDEVEYGNFTYVNNQDVEWFRASTANMGASNVNFYIDAVSFSWDPNYNIANNLNEGLLLSYDNITNLDWKGFSLDGLVNKTIHGNTTIPMPADGLHTIQVFGNDTMGTTYESNLRYFSVDTIPYIDILTPENKTYIEAMSGYYPATYGFENDDVGSDPEDWVIWAEDDIIEVIDELDGHKRVLRLYDSSSSSQNHVQNEFSPKDRGQFEFWMRTTDVNDHVAINIINGSDTHLIRFRIKDGFFGVEEGVNIQQIAAASNNNWYHIRIVFRGSYSSNYLGLTDYYSWKVFIDDVEYGPYDFYQNNHDDPEWFRVSTANIGASIVNLYVDAVGFSWDPSYTIGDNLDEGLLLGFESNLDFNWTGYSLDGQANNTIIGNSTISMPSDGLHRIQVFGNDSLGTMYESDVRYFTTNALGPDISITSPISNQLYGTTSPDFSLTIPDSDLDATWYSLDGGTTNVPFSGLSGTIDQTEWDKMGNGTVTITFYANDTANNIGQAEVTVRKDIITPIITINEPSNAEVFEDPPIFDLTVDEANLEEMWYTLDGGLTNITISHTDGIVSQSEWNSVPDGPLTIRFYARDWAGNEAYDDVYVVKRSSEQPTPPGIPGYNLLALIGLTLVVSLILAKRKLKK